VPGMAGASSGIDGSRPLDAPRRRDRAQPCLSRAWVGAPSPGLAGEGRSDVQGSQFGPGPPPGLYQTRPTGAIHVHTSRRNRQLPRSVYKYRPAPTALDTGGRPASRIWQRRRCWRTLTPAPRPKHPTSRQPATRLPKLFDRRAGGKQRPRADLSAPTAAWCQVGTAGGTEGARGAGRSSFAARPSPAARCVQKRAQPGRSTSIPPGPTATTREARTKTCPPRPPDDHTLTPRTLPCGV
jgi:hypothetical protein